MKDRLNDLTSSKGGPTLESFSYKIYRFFQNQIINRFILPLVFSRDRLESQGAWSALASYERTQGSIRIWFHASSVGELEAISPIVQQFARLGAELIITVFSESAERSFKNLVGTLKGSPGKILFAGFSPWEGTWNQFLTKMKPDLFITFKYEAWPDLWASLALLNIPLLLLGAKNRTSLRIAKRASEWFVGRVPSLILATVNELDSVGLRGLFPDSENVIVGEPRWDRVSERIKSISPRMKILMEIGSTFRRPWGVLGSVWMSDLSVLRSIIDDAAEKGTLWVVPHDIESENVRKMEAFFLSMGLKVLKTTELLTIRSHSLDPSMGPYVILVDEMGLLVELYSQVQWVLIGGGFSKGIHSTIEPALQGVPIACGPKSVEKFSETSYLKSLGQLRVCESKKDFESWYFSIDSELSVEKREKWKGAHLSQLGASDRIVQLISKRGFHETTR